MDLFIGITLGFGVVLVLGALGVLGDLLAPVACKVAGFIGQNVYLFCASENLATVFRGSVDTVKLGRALQLPDQQFVTFAQTVGFPRI